MSQTIISDITIALIWCLAWGEQRQPQYPYLDLHQMRNALKQNGELPPKLQALRQQVLDCQNHLDNPPSLAEIKENFPALWNQTTSIGLVYGGVTKVKQYVFESAKLPEIRGASALLDKINLVDLPAFFNRLPQKCQENDQENLQKNCEKVRHWLDDNFPDLSFALIPELIIYCTGGNILAFCPAAFVDDLANAIEKRYTHETITANSCAVGDTFRLLEIRFGLLAKNLEETKWLDWYLEHKEHDLVKAYFDLPTGENQEPQALFFNRKSFNELAGKLAAEFQKRRNGNDTPHRPSRRYPVMLETHPYLMRDESDRASAIFKAEGLPNSPYFSKPLARKRLIGQIAKKEEPGNWYPFEWRPEESTVRGWITKFRDYLAKDKTRLDNYYQAINLQKIELKEAQTLAEIGDSSDGYVAFIYADGNNMGGYIQKIKTPEEYQKFSKDVSIATEKSVYIALEKHLKSEKESSNKNGDYIYPFEIITIGGDDVLLIVPANKALEVAHTIGVEFERILLEKNSEKYSLNDQNYDHNNCHRYKKLGNENINHPQCKLSMSIGVLISSSDTPVYYAEKLTEDLLKLAKRRAKVLKKDGYHGGTIDFMVLKGVTMLSGKIEDFRKQGLTHKINKSPSLKLYASPYTIREIEGLIETVRAFKQTSFPRSQLYQIRSLLEQGKRTAILNYRYFKVRLELDKQNILKENFEDRWCLPKDPENHGNLAPWMYYQDEKGDKYYETIWREIVDLYDFITEETTVKSASAMEERK